MRFFFVVTALQFHYGIEVAEIVALYAGRLTHTLFWVGRVEINSKCVLRGIAMGRQALAGAQVADTQVDGFFFSLSLTASGAS